MIPDVRTVHRQGTATKEGHRTKDRFANSLVQS